ncbi:hypothetical protein N9B82_04215 [Saprospiraceae bacterium]|nr:hypothetical protein [Saprospiraceae bacterium]
MKKQFSITALTFLFMMVANLSFGQNKLGVRFFQGFQNQATESQYLVGPQNTVDYKLELGQISNSQTVGLFSQFEFGFLYFQPEFLYTRYSVSYELEDFSAESGTELSTIVENRQQFDVPVNAGVKFKGFRIGGGPIFHFAQEFESNFTDFSNITLQKKDISAGFQGSLGYDWSVFHFDLRYQTDFNSVTDHLRFSQRGLKTKANTSSVQLGVAVALGRK